MNDKKTMNGLRATVMSINVLLMCITVVLQLWAFETLRHTILCACVLLLITITLVFDGILKDSKGMITHGSWYALWLFSLIMALFRF